MKNAPNKINLFKCYLNTNIPGDINHIVDLAEEINYLRLHFFKLLKFEFNDDFLNMVGFIDEDLRKELLDDKH